MADYITNKRKINEALLNMIRLKDSNENAWVVINDSDSDAFVQFRCEFDAPIFLDFPIDYITDLELARAKDLFISLGVFEPTKIVLVNNEEDANKLGSLIEILGTTSFEVLSPYLTDINYDLLNVYKYNFGSDCERAAEFALKLLNDVFLLGEDINLVINKGWE